MVKPNLGNENYDGIINLPDGSRVLVEITSAKDGYSESLRMEVLEREGRVNAIGPVSVSGKRNSPERAIDVGNEAMDHDVLVGEHMALVATRICAKAKPKYSPDHVLLVTVDDYVPFRTESDISRLMAFVRSLVRTLPLEFGKLAVIGESGRLLFELAVPKSSSPNAL